MKLLQASLVLVSVLAPAVWGQTAFTIFKYQHFRDFFGNCNGAMVELHQRTRRAWCKDVNSFIVGNINDVVQICRGSGTRVPNTEDRYKSTRNFRVVTCVKKRTSPDYVPRNFNDPQCDYWQNEGPPQQIIVGCDRNNNPVHFQYSGN